MNQLTKTNVAIKKAYYKFIFSLDTDNNHMLSLLNQQVILDRTVLLILFNSFLLDDGISASS